MHVNLSYIFISQKKLRPVFVFYMMSLSNVIHFLVCGLQYYCFLICIFITYLVWSNFKLVTHSFKTWRTDFQGKISCNVNNKFSSWDIQPLYFRMYKYICSSFTFISIFLVFVCQYIQESYPSRINLHSNY